MKATLGLTVAPHVLSLSKSPPPTPGLAISIWMVICFAQLIFFRHTGTTCVLICCSMNSAVMLTSRSIGTPAGRLFDLRFVTSGTEHRQMPTRPLNLRAAPGRLMADKNMTFGMCDLDEIGVRPGPLSSVHSGSTFRFRFRMSV